MKKLSAFLLVLVLAFTGCKSLSKKKKDAEAAKKPDEIATAQEGAEVDFQAFIGRLRSAVRSHDVDAVAGMMIPDFAFVMGAMPEQDRKGEGVFQFWDENGLWPELDGILSEKFVKKGEYMVAPPQFANPAIDYDGYRAGVRRVNGSWKFAYFVNGAAQ